MGPTWGPPGSCRPQMGPMLDPWILLLGRDEMAKPTRWCIYLATVHHLFGYSHLFYAVKVSILTNQITVEWWLSKILCIFEACTMVWHVLIEAHLAQWILDDACLLSLTQSGGDTMMVSMHASVCSSFCPGFQTIIWKSIHSIHLIQDEYTYKVRFQKHLDFRPCWSNFYPLVVTEWLTLVLSDHHLNNIIAQHVSIFRFGMNIYCMIFHKC